MTGPSDLNEQKERLRVLLNDDGPVRKDSMHSRAAAEADNIRGRFAAHEKASVTGTTPTWDAPAAPNWSHDPSGVEPPLNQDVNAMEPVGTEEEILRSLSLIQAAEGRDDLISNPAMPSSLSPSTTQPGAGDTGDTSVHLTEVGADEGAADLPSVAAPSPSQPFRKRNFNT